MERSARNRAKSLGQTEPTILRPHRDETRNHQTSNETFNEDLKAKLALGVFAFFVTLLIIYDIICSFQEAKKPASETINPPQFEGPGANKESLYWGTDRPRVYLGIRARNPRSLIAGLMWIGGKDRRTFIRHVRRESDELSIYSWTLDNDGSFKHQVIVDHDMNLATSFFKSKVEDSGFGGDWALRLDVQSNKSNGNEEFWRNADLCFYLADEDGNALTSGGDTFGMHDNSLLASGSRTNVGSWQLHLKSLNELEVHYVGFKRPHIQNLTALVEEYYGPQSGRLQLPDKSDASPNILVFQISARIPFKADIAFISGNDLESSRVEERVSSLTGDSLTSQLMEKEREFDTKFGKNFNLDGKVDQATDELNKRAPLAFAKHVASQAHGFVDKAWDKAHRFVKDAQSGDRRTAINQAATEYKQLLLNQSASVAEKATSAATYWSEKYNHMVKDLTLKGYNISGYLPFGSVDKMSKGRKEGDVRKGGNAAALVEHT